MAVYISFLFKRLLKRKSNYIVFVLIALIITVVHVLNETNQDRIIKNVQNEISFYQDSMSDDQIMDLEQEIKNREEIIRNYEEDDWINMYQNYIQVIKENQKMLTNDPNSESDQNYDSMLKQSDQQIAYFEYLEKNNLSYEDQEYPVFSATFTMHIFEMFLPIVFLAYIVYIMAQLYTFDISEGIDVSKLLPLNTSKRELVQIGVGMIFVIISILGMMFVSFVISFLLTKNIGLGYPVLEDSYVNDSWQMVSVNEKLLECIILGILYGFSISLIMYFFFEKN